MRLSRTDGAREVVATPAATVEVRSTDASGLPPPLPASIKPKGGALARLGKACAYSVAAGAVLLSVMVGGKPASAHEVYQQVYEPTAICSVWTGQCFYGPPRVVIRPVPHSHDAVVVLPANPSGVVVVPPRPSLGERVIEGVAQGVGQAIGFCVVSGQC